MTELVFLTAVAAAMVVFSRVASRRRRDQADREYLKRFVSRL